MRKHFLSFLVSVLLPLSVLAQNNNRFEVTAKDITYNGDAPESNISVKVGSKTLTNGQDYTISYKYGNDLVQKVRDVGAYTVTITPVGTGDYFNYPSATANFNVTPKDLKIALNSNSVTKSYGEKNSSIELSNIINTSSSDTPAPGDNLSDILKAMKWTVYEVGKSESLTDGEEPANTDLNIVLSNEEGANYNVTIESTGSDKTLLLTVNPLQVTLAFKQPDKDKIEYTGENIDVASLIALSIPTKLPNEQTINDLKVSYEIKQNDKKVYIKNAGTYNVTISKWDNPNYIVTLSSGEFVVKKAKLDLNQKTKQSKVYGAADPDFNDRLKASLKPGDSFDTLLGTDGKEHKMTMFRGEDPTSNFEDLTKLTVSEDVDPAGYYVRPALDGKILRTSSYNDQDGIGALQNYDIVYDLGTENNKFWINPVTVNISIDTESLDEIIYGISGSNVEKALKALEYSIKVGDNEAVSASVSAKAPFDLVTIGTGETATTDKLSALPAVKVNWGEGVTKAPTTPAAGTYTIGFDQTDDNDGVTLSAGNKDNYKFIFSSDDEKTTQSFDIAKATLTITALPQTITYGGDEEDINLAVTANTVQSTVATHEGDNVEIISNSAQKLSATIINNIIKAITPAEGTILTLAEGVSFDKVTTIKEVITFAVSAKEVEYPNYDIEFVAGDLIIAPESTLKLDGSVIGDEVTSLLKAYNEETVKNVSITHINQFLTNFDGDENYQDDTDTKRILKAGRWYTLVLPFEVKVSELSKQFEYAIVNVPDESNTNHDDIKFRLEMQTVPANTLMAFKISYDMTFEKTAAIKFSNKRIEYPGEAAVTDIAGNLFTGVYSLAELDGTNNEYYLNPTNGKFRDVYTVANYLGEKIKIYPFNGYIGSATSNARVLMQEADGTVTAIDVVSGEEVNGAEGWYTINGVKLNAEPTEKGIYINNGKKVVIK